MESAPRKRNVLHFLWKKILGQSPVQPPPPVAKPDRWSETRAYDVMLQRQRTGDEVLYRYRHSRKDSGHASLRAQDTFGQEGGADDAQLASAFGLDSKVILKEPRDDIAVDGKPKIGAGPPELAVQDSGADEEQCLAQRMPSKGCSSAPLTTHALAGTMLSEAGTDECVSTLAAERCIARTQEQARQDAAVRELAALRIQHAASLHILPGVYAAYSLSDGPDSYHYPRSGRSARLERKKKQRWLGSSEPKCLKKCLSAPINL